MGRRLILLLLTAWFTTSSLAAAVPEITAQQLLDNAEKYYVLDVRTQEEFANGHIPNARLLPYDTIQSGHQQLPPHKDTTIVLYCRSGRRAGIAAEKLLELGYGNLHHLSGDMQQWRENGHPISHVSASQ